MYFYTFRSVCAGKQCWNTRDDRDNNDHYNADNGCNCCDGNTRNNDCDNVNDSRNNNPSSKVSTGSSRKDSSPNTMANAIQYMLEHKCMLLPAS